MVVALSGIAPILTFPRNRGRESITRASTADVRRVACHAAANDSIG
jgi:hypothetical protein